MPLVFLAQLVFQALTDFQDLKVCVYYIDTNYDSGEIISLVGEAGFAGLPGPSGRLFLID